MALTENQNMTEWVLDVGVRPFMSAGLYLAYKILAENQYPGFSLSSPLLRNSVLLGASVFVSEVTVDMIALGSNEAIKNNAVLASLQKTILQPSITGFLYAGSTGLLDGNMSRELMVRRFAIGATTDVFSEFLIEPARELF